MCKLIEKETVTRGAPSSKHHFELDGANQMHMSTMMVYNIILWNRTLLPITKHTTMGKRILRNS